MPIRDEAPGRRPRRPLPRGPRRGPDGARPALRLRPRRAVGAPVHRRRRPDRDRRAGRRPPHPRPPDPRARPHDRRRVRARGRRRGPVRAHLVPVARAGAGAGRRPGRDRATRPPGGRSGRRARPYAASTRDARPAQPDHAQGAHVRADRRHRRRADDLAAGADRRRAQLGLPLLLGARRDAHAPVAPARRLHGRGARVARLAAARRGRLTGGDADHVRPGGRAAAHRARCSTGCPATRTPRRSGSATRRRASSSSTCTAS